ERVRGEQPCRGGHGDPEVVTVERESLIEAEVGDQPEGGLDGCGQGGEGDPIGEVDAGDAECLEDDPGGEGEGEPQARQQHASLSSTGFIHGSPPCSSPRLPGQNNGPTFTSMRQLPSVAAPMATPSGPTGVGQTAPNSAPPTARPFVPARSIGSSTTAARRRSRRK